MSEPLKNSLNNVAAPAEEKIAEQVAAFLEERCPHHRSGYVITAIIVDPADAVIILEL